MERKVILAFLFFYLLVSEIVYAVPPFQDIVSDISGALTDIFDVTYDFLLSLASFIGYENLYQNQVFSILIPTLIGVFIFFVIRGIYKESIHVGPVHFEALRFHENLKIAPAIISILIFLYFINEIMFGVVLIVFLNFTFVLFDMILESFGNIFNDARVPVGMAALLTFLVNGVIYETGQYKKIVELAVGLGIALPLVVLAIFVLYYIIKRWKARRPKSLKEEAMSEFEQSEEKIKKVRMEQAGIAAAEERLKRRMIKEKDPVKLQKLSLALENLRKRRFQEEVEETALEQEEKKILDKKPPSETYEQRKKRYEEGFKE